MGMGPSRGDGLRQASDCTLAPAKAAVGQSVSMAGQALSRWRREGTACQAEGTANFSLAPAT